MKKKKSFRQKTYYNPSTSPQPRKIIASGDAKIVKNTRQLRRAQQRGG